jgi:hypothetical protein
VPAAAVPESFEPVKLPVVGASWIRRGAAYWVRRVVFSLSVLVGFGGGDLDESIKAMWDLIAGLRDTGSVGMNAFAPEPAKRPTAGVVVPVTGRAA